MCRDLHREAGEIELVRGASYCPEHQPAHRWPKRQRPRTSRAGHQQRRLRVLARDGHRCQLRYDGCQGVATVCDHIVVLALGGQDTHANCAAVCEHCHRKKTSAEGYAARRMVR